MLNLPFTSHEQDTSRVLKLSSSASSRRATLVPDRPSPPYDVPVAGGSGILSTSLLAMWACAKFRQWLTGTVFLRTEDFADLAAPPRLLAAFCAAACGMRGRCQLTNPDENSTMKRLASNMSKVLSAVTLVTLLSACSGSDGSTPTVSGNPPGSSSPPNDIPQTPTTEGIATPSSVSVVTATNAD